MKELLNKNEEQLQETVLITGATGFLGEYIVRRLIKKYRVLALGRNQKRGKYLESLGLNMSFMGAPSQPYGGDGRTFIKPM